MRIGNVHLTEHAAKEVEHAVSRALLEGAPAEEVHRTVSLHVARYGEQLPRIPAVGLEPGAIRGTVPHRARFIYRETPRENE